MDLEVPVALALFAAAMAVAFSAGWRRGVLSPAFWWTLSAFAYTMVPLPTVMSVEYVATRSYSIPKSSIYEYVLFVAAVSLALSLGWRVGWARHKGGAGDPAGVFPVPSLSIKRLYLLEVAGFALTMGGTVLSGINPMYLLTTVSSAGYSYYEPGEFRFAILNAIGGGLSHLSPPMILLLAMRGSDLWVKVGALFNFSFFLSLAILTGVRGSVLSMLVLTMLIFIAVPPQSTGRKVVRVSMAVLVAAGSLAFYQIAVWMQNARGAGGETDKRSLSDLALYLDLLTPSAAVVEWVKSNGFGPGVSIRDAIIQAPPSFIIPVQDRAQFLQIVDAINAPNVGAAVSSAAELYYNAGWLVGIAVMLLLGYWLGRFQNRAEVRASDARYFLILVVLSPAFMGIASRGYLWATLVGLGGALIFPWLVGRLARSPVPKATHDGLTHANRVSAKR